MKYSLAPMLKITNPEFRLLMSIISPNVKLFTEMIVDKTVLHVDNDKLYSMLGKPNSNTVVQIGGSEPEDVAKSIIKLKNIGWTLFNLNCGCPSTRVQSGSFGAKLMLDVKRVTSIINSVYELTGIIISLKIRTGVDENDSYEFFESFITYVKNNTPCTEFYVHARKCWLKGLNPKQNRNIPPLNYEFVYQIKKQYPELEIHLNGGIGKCKLTDFENIDGIMIGRAAVENIKIYNDIDAVEISMKAAVKEYLNKATNLKYNKNKVLISLNKLRKGQFNNKKYKITIQELIRQDININDIYDKIFLFFDN